MASDGATLCSFQGGSLKREEKFTVRECCQYLTHNRIDRTQIWRKVGCVLACDVEALRKRMEQDVGRQPLQGTMVGGCRRGFAPPSRKKRRGNRGARRQCQRAKREVLRGDCTLSKAVDAMLSPLQGGSPHPTKERLAQLQLMQRFAMSRLEKGDQSGQDEGQAIYVGITNPTNRLATTDEKSGEKGTWGYWC